MNPMPTNSKNTGKYVISFTKMHSMSDHHQNKGFK